MNVLQQTMERIQGLDQEMMEKARERVDSLIKPPHSLGKLEELAVQLAGISGELYPEFDRKAIIVMAADHGVYEEGISSNPQEVTYAQTMFIAKGITGVGVLAKTAGAEVVTVDIGFPAGVVTINEQIEEHWTVARAWLFQQLGPAPPAP